WHDSYSISRSPGRHPDLNPVLRSNLKELLDVLGRRCRGFGFPVDRLPTYLQEEVLQSRRRHHDQHPGGFRPGVLERVQRTPGESDPGSRSCREIETIGMELEFPLQNVKSLIFPAMDMRRRTTAGRHNRLHEGVSSARVIIAAFYRVTVADNPDRPTLTRNHDSVVHRGDPPSSVFVEEICLSTRAALGTSSASQACQSLRLSPSLSSGSNEGYPRVRVLVFSEIGAESGIQSGRREDLMGFTQTNAIEVKQIKGKGRGVFARRLIHDGEVIERVLVLPVGETRTASGPTRMSGYCFEWGRGTVAVALGYGSLYNHSYQPNARYDDESGQTKVFRAIRDIAPGEEIVVNYNGEPGDKTPVWFKVMQSEPSPKEPERPVAHTGSGNEADAREPHGNHLRAKTDLPAEGKT